jgi:hypothetical protein
MQRLAIRSILLTTVLVGATLPAHAQRRAADGAIPDAAAARILYRNDFENPADAGFEASAYGSARFLTGKYKEEADQAKVSGFTVGVAGQPETAYGSRGALKLAATSSDAQGVAAERYFDWPADNATVVLLVYAHGVNSFYLQGWGRKAGRNFHAEVPVAKQDEWQFVKLNASAFVGWGAGSVSPGETFGNLTIVANGLDKSVDHAFLLVDNLAIFQGADSVPPSAPADVKAAADPKSGGVALTWKPATDDVCVSAYEVHRSTEADFKPATKTRLATISALQYADREVQPGQTYHYAIVAKDAGGNRMPSPAVTAIAPPAAAGAGGAKKEEF